MKKLLTARFFIFEIILYISILRIIPEVENFFKLILIFVESLILYRFTFVLHDCSHYSLFRNRQLNKIMGNIIAGVLFTTFSSFKLDHYNHHKYIWEKQDPQIDDYSNVSFDTFSVYFHLLKPLLFLNLFSKIPNTFKIKKFLKENNSSRKRFPNKNIFFGIVNILIIQSLIFFIITSGGRMISIFPVYLLISLSTVLFLSRLRAYLEHGPLCIDDLNKVIIRSHSPGLFGRLFLSNLWFSYHNEHHLKPHFPSNLLKSLNKKYCFDHERPPSSYLASFLKLTINLSNPSQLRHNPFINKPEIKSEYVNCGFCNSNIYDFYSESRDYEYETSSNLWRFVKCKKCNNVYLNPRPLDSEIPLIYPSNYYSYNYKKISYVSRNLKKIIDKKRLKEIINDSKKNINGKYLDIGCGDGRYLKLMEHQGFDSKSIFGTEVFKDTVEDLKFKGFNVFLSAPDSLKNLPNNSFSIITMFSVLEHVGNPYKVLEKCYELLEEDGVLVFEVPNINSTNGWIFKDNYWGGYHTPRHWNLFNIDTVISVASEIGFKLKSFKRSTGHSFWVWSFHHYVKYKLGLKKIGNIFNPLFCWPIVLPITLIDFIRVKRNRETDNMIITLIK